MYLTNKKRKIFISLLVTSLFVFTSYCSYAVPSDWAKDAFDGLRAENLIPDGFTQNYQDDITRQEFCKLIIPLYNKVAEEKDLLQPEDGQVKQDDNASTKDDTPTTQNGEPQTQNGEPLTQNQKPLTQNGEPLAQDDYTTDQIVKSDETGNVQQIAKFTDTDDESVLKAQQLGLVQGNSENKFLPSNPISREEISVIITRLIDICFPNADKTLHPVYSFDDEWKIDDWAKSSLEYLYFHQIINGTDNYVISPLSNTTVEEAMVMLYKVYQNKDSFAIKTDISDKFEWQIEPIYDGLGPNTKFSGGLAAVSKNGKYGYIDQEGNVAVKFQYDMAYEFSEGMAQVIKDNKSGFINKKGEVVIPLEYDEAGHFSEERVWLRKGNKYGFADISGNIAVPFDYDYAYPYKEGLAPVKKDGEYGYIDKNNSVVIPFQFIWASSFSEGMARIQKNGRYSYIDKNGNIALDLNYQYLFDFKSGRAVVFNLDQYAVINSEGEIVVPFNKYGFIFNYSDGLARVHSNSGYEGQFGFVGMDGLQKIPLKFSFFDAEDFSEGLAPVASHINETDTVTRSYIDKNGNCVYPKREDIKKYSEYDDQTFYLQRFSEGMAAVVTQKGKLGFVKNPLLY